MLHLCPLKLQVAFQFYAGIMIEVWSQSPKAYVVKAVYPQSNIAMDKSLFLDDFTINTFIYIDLWWIFQLATFDFPPFRKTPVVAVARNVQISSRSRGAWLSFAACKWQGSRLTRCLLGAESTDPGNVRVMWLGRIPSQLAK